MQILTCQRRVILPVFNKIPQLALHYRNISFDIKPKIKRVQFALDCHRFNETKWVLTKKAYTRLRKTKSAYKTL